MSASTTDVSRGVLTGVLAAVLVIGGLIGAFVLASNHRQTKEDRAGCQSLQQTMATAPRYDALAYERARSNAILSACREKGYLN